MAVLFDLTTSPPPKTLASGSFNVLRTGAWKYRWTSSYAHTSLPRTYCVQFTFTTDDKAALYVSNWSGTTRVEISDTTGGLVWSQAVTFANGAAIDVTLDPVSRTITLAGFLTCNGTYKSPGTLVSWGPTGQTLCIGGGYAGGYEAGGTFGDIQDTSPVPPSGIKVSVVGASVCQGFHDGIQTSVYAITGSSGLVARIPGITMASLTSAGYRAETALANYAGLIAPMYDATKARNILFVFGDLAINDIYGTNGTDGRTAAQTLGYFNGIATAAKTTGFEVVSSTTTPVAHPQDTIQQAFDALLRASSSFDRCIDVRAATVGGGSLQYLLPPGRPQNGNALYENTGDTHLSDGPYIAPRVQGGYDYLTSFVAPQMRNYIDPSFVPGGGAAFRLRTRGGRRGGRRR